MAKSVYEFWLSFGNGAERLRLPVLPPVLEISNPSQNDSISISKLGELTIIQDPMSKEFSFSSFFPKYESSLTEYNGFPSPWECIEMIERWKNSGKPMRFVVTGTPINFPVTIENFLYREGDSGIGDIDYTIVFKEFKFNAVRKISLKKEVSTSSTRPNPQPVPKTYTVKKGDTLWAIARIYYNDSLQWRKIWEANKDAIIKRDKRNLKQPGHWIHIGEKLVIK